jgi:hypothetical protein
MKVRITMLNVLRFASMLLTAVSMAGGLAHLFELPNKINLPSEDYLTVQQIYRGWALLGIAVVGALLSTATLAFYIRHTPTEFYPTLAAATCIAVSLIVFFLFTFPVNKQTENWTTLPENWEVLRWRWEYSHAVGAGLYFLAVTLLILALLVGRRE